MTGESETLPRFSLSGLPRILEWYECYYDPSKERLVDGMELYQARNDWKERSKSKWHFFYRPVRAMVGRPQRKLITEREIGVERAQHELHTATRSFILRLGITLGSMIPALWLWEPLALLLLALGGVQGILYYRVRRRIERRIAQLRGEISKLNGEIQELLNQIPKLPATLEVEEWRAEELQGIERSSLSEITGRALGDPDLFKDLTHEPLDDEDLYGLRCLLIEAWAALQEREVRGPFGKEQTGLQSVEKAVGSAISTWRAGSRDQPIFRVAYLQFIFLLHRNLNVHSFFYDFVTCKKYGVRSETFQYNHVTNYAIREVALEESLVISGLPERFWKRMRDESINAFSIMVASGSRYQCILSDDTVVDCLNELLETDIAFQRLESVRIDKKTSEELGEEWTKALQAKLEKQATDDLDAFKRELRDKRTKLQNQGIHKARRVVQQIRMSIEKYTHNVLEAGRLRQSV